MNAMEVFFHGFMFFFDKKPSTSAVKSEIMPKQQLAEELSN